MSFYETNICERMRRLNWTADCVSATTRHLGHLVSKTTISNAFSGARDFDANTSLYLTDLLTKVEGIAQAAHPLALNMRDSKMLAKLIKESDEAAQDLPSLADLLLVNRVLSGQDFQELADSRNIGVAKLREKVFEVRIKLARASTRIAEIMEENNADT